MAKRTDKEVEEFEDKICRSSVAFIYPSSDAPEETPIVGVLFSAEEVTVEGENGYAFKVESEFGPEEARDAYKGMPKGHMGWLVSPSGLSRVCVHGDLALYAGPLLNFLDSVEQVVLSKVKMVPLTVNSKSVKS